MVLCTCGKSDRGPVFGCARHKSGRRGLARPLGLFALRSIRVARGSSDLLVFVSRRPTGTSKLNGHDREHNDSDSQFLATEFDRTERAIRQDPRVDAWLLAEPEETDRKREAQGA